MIREELTFQLRQEVVVQADRAVSLMTLSREKLGMLEEQRGGQ